MSTVSLTGYNELVGNTRMLPVPETVLIDPNILEGLEDLDNYKKRQIIITIYNASVKSRKGWLAKRKTELGYDLKESKMLCELEVQGYLHEHQGSLYPTLKMVKAVIEYLKK